MSLKVVKFGGSSLADANQMKKAANIIKADAGRKYIVVSAPGKRFSGDIKVTDLLYSLYDNRNSEKFDSVFSAVKSRFYSIIDDLGIKVNLEREFNEIEKNIKISTTPDYAASRGEYLNAIIFSVYTEFEFVDAAETVFFDNFGKFDSKKTYNVLRNILPEKQGCVIPGFFGSNPDNTVKTFSRGGSDITGSIIARAVNADVYENWTDVSGMLMADPAIVDNPKVIPSVTYRELRELSYMGAVVLHEDAVFPVSEAGIPINIKNTNFPEHKGTIISAEPLENIKSGNITGIAGKVGFSSILVEKDMMNNEIGIGRKVLQILEEYGISFEHLTSGIDSMGVIVSTESIKDIKDEILDKIIRTVDADSVSVEDGIALIAVVGRGMIKEKGTAAKVFTAAANAGVNIKLIDQGSFELSIIIGVDEKDYVKIINALYKQFDSEFCK